MGSSPSLFCIHVLCEFVSLQSIFWTVLFDVLFSFLFLPISLQQNDSLPSFRRWSGNCFWSRPHFHYDCNAYFMPLISPSLHYCRHKWTFICLSLLLSTVMFASIHTRTHPHTCTCCHHHHQRRRQTYSTRYAKLIKHQNQNDDETGKPADILQKVHLPVINNGICSSWYQSQGKHVVISSRQFCAGFKEGGKDACQV